ncbi:MAG: UDP-N-acetylglucosamine--N-acetylmuramyl-(pentapeptide) pyrophosphoryl-undecaprenol N-acetylglucosamine transferase [Gemmatimonadota bacterium]|jgi:UDP-N-acetylglucosamine--N-acetylmuramyl-(pentapeptide) pyrophosphoryl-undecaprenol N-acetylglucosamine transferase
MDEPRVVVFAGGGTGGHLYPALALADALERLRPDVRPYFVGALRGIESRVLPAQGRDHVLLPVRGIARGEGLANWRVAPALVRSLREVDRLLRRLGPELVVVTGGYAGAPAGIVGVLQGLPVALQEQNAVPGVTTRLLARWARQIHVAFPEAVDRLPGRSAQRARHSGNPVRPPEEIDRASARRTFDLEPDARVVLVVGGSQGSAALNRLVVEAVEGIRSGRVRRGEDVQVLWATGPDNLDDVRRALGGEAPRWLRVLGYIDAMPRALAATDVALSRAGAMATSEFLAWGIPMVLVPLPTAAADHQTHNARTLAEAGAAIHLPQEGLGGSELWETVEGLVDDPARLEALRKAARERGRPESAARIATALAELLPAPMSAEDGASPGSGDDR